MFLRSLILAFDKAGVRYAVVGGVAVNLHGVPRMTYDVDIAITMTVVNLVACRTALEGLGLRCRLPLVLDELAPSGMRQQLRDERNLVAVTFTDPSNPLREVDVLVAPDIDPDGVVERAIARDAGDFVVRVGAIPDLIRMKRGSGRARDAADAVMLERLVRGGDDS